VWACILIYVQLRGKMHAGEWCYEVVASCKVQQVVRCDFSLGISKKVCYKVALCENCQRQTCKAFTGLSIRAQIVGGGHPLKYKFFS